MLEVKRGARLFQSGLEFLWCLRPLIWCCTLHDVHEPCLARCLCFAWQPPQAPFKGSFARGQVLTPDVLAAALVAAGFT
jgi:hypothetical protein